MMTTPVISSVAMETVGQHRTTRWSIPLWPLELILLIPAGVWFFQRLNDGSDEPLGLLTLALAIGLAWRDRKALAVSDFSRCMGAAFLILSIVSTAHVPPMVRAGLSLIGVAWIHGLHRNAGVIGLLFLSLPVAASMQFYLGYPLQVASADLAVKMLEMWGVSVVRIGSQLDLAGHVVGVDPACAGVRLLWHASAAAMGLAGIYRLKWLRAIVLGVLAVVMVLPVNALRAAVLAAESSGKVSLGALGHESTGLIAFLLLLVPLTWVASSWARPSVPAVSTAAPTRGISFILLAGAFLAPFFMNQRVGQHISRGDLALPESFSFSGMNQRLKPLPPTQAEAVASLSFPGTMGSYQWGEDVVVLRKVPAATRSLHSSVDCLKAGGYQIGESRVVTLDDGTTWTRFQVSKDGVRSVVYERFVSTIDGATWTDVSAWYWYALWHPLNGPWVAETVVTL